MGPCGVSGNAAKLFSSCGSARPGSISVSGGLKGTGREGKPSNGEGLLNGALLIKRDITPSGDSNACKRTGSVSTPPG